MKDCVIIIVVYEGKGIISCKRIPIIVETLKLRNLAPCPCLDAHIQSIAKTYGILM